MNNLLILDVDETILHSTTEWLGRRSDFAWEGMGFVYLRPGLSDFLSAVGAKYKLALWSAATEDYLINVVNCIFSDIDLAFSWCRNKCDIQEYPNGEPLFVKDLQSVIIEGYDLTNVVIVDDRPEGFPNNKDNLVQITPYYGGLDDHELEVLAKYLVGLSNSSDIRSASKEQWK